MARYFLQLAYKGTAYHGWQRQPDTKTVQGVLEDALAKRLREEVETVGCGRTDTGVHAKDFYAHFDTEQNIEGQDLVYSLNGLLPPDIAIKALIPVGAEAHARFDADSRTYHYLMHRVKDPFVADDSTYHSGELDLEMMNEAARLLLDTKDFASFAKAHAGHHTTICDVREAEWTLDGDRLCFRITADRFLRNMVRAIVGTLVDVGTGRMDVSEFKAVLEKQDRSAAGRSMPAQGLYLYRVTYPYLNEHG